MICTNNFCIKINVTSVLVIFIKVIEINNLLYLKSYFICCINYCLFPQRHLGLYYNFNCLWFLKFKLFKFIILIALFFCVTFSVISLFSLKYWRYTYTLHYSKPLLISEVEAGGIHGTMLPKTRYFSILFYGIDIASSYLYCLHAINIIRIFFKKGIY